MVRLLCDLRSLAYETSLIFRGKDIRSFDKDWSYGQGYWCDWGKHSLDPLNTEFGSVCLGQYFSLLASFHQEFSAGELFCSFRKCNIVKSNKNVKWQWMRWVHYTQRRMLLSSYSDYRDKKKNRMQQPSPSLFH